MYMFHLQNSLKFRQILKYKAEGLQCNLNMESFSPLFLATDWLIFYVRRPLKIRPLKTVYYTRASIIRDAIHHINICRLNSYFKCYRYAIC
jgi:hypothetical protein